MVVRTNEKESSDGNIDPVFYCRANRLIHYEIDNFIVLCFYLFVSYKSIKYHLIIHQIA